MIDDIQLIWGEIEEHRINHESIGARPLPVKGMESADVLLCITETGNPGILLRNAGGTVTLPKPGCGRLLVRREPLMREGSQPEDYIRIECLDSNLRQPFAVLASQVVNHLASGATASRACMDAVLEFRRLLSRHGGVLPSEEEILGLAGELLLIRTLVSAAPHLWQGWNGPLGSSRDYSWGTTDIEAKASRLAGDARLTVNGLEQLEPEGGRSLFIHHSVLSDNPIGTIVIPLMADEIRDVIADPEAFDERLASAGYMPEQRELWLEHRFTLHETTWFKVTDDFPRIGRSDFPEGTLPLGVSRLRYDILLASCSGFRLSAAETRQMISTLSSSTCES
jgi:hypothetical protein